MKKAYSKILFCSDSLKVTFFHLQTETNDKTKLFENKNSYKYYIYYCLSDHLSCSMIDKHIKLKKGNIVILRPNENIKFYSNAAFNIIGSEFFVGKTYMNLLEIEVVDKIFENDIDINGFFRAFNERERYKFNIFSDDEFYPTDFLKNCALQLGTYITNSLDPYVFKSVVATIITQLNFNFDKSHNYSPTKYSREYELKIYDYISRNFNKNITIKHLHDEFFVSKTYINKVTNRFYGMNFNEMLLSKRMWEAIDLMKKKVELNKVATLCGYKNYSSFYRNFLKYFGVTPTERQKEINNLIKKRDFIKLKELTKQKADSN
ncbi:MAG: helix-turn-helix transcriptional regulator [Clostridia bacterium]|nr:helix-turn-helix transcriptional regulator [Clostridia bacterium]